MKTEVSLPDLLAIIEIVDEHVDRNFPGVLSASWRSRWNAAND